jgi:hypothetical protein
LSKKSPPIGGLFYSNASRLFELRFLIDDVLARHGVEFLHFYLVRRRPFVLRRGIEVSGSGGRFQLDFLSHVALRDGGLKLIAARAQFGQNHVDAFLIDRTQAGIADPHVHPAVFAFNPEAAVLQVGQKPAFGFIVGMRHAVPDHGLLAGNFTYSRHDGFSRLYFSICFYESGRRCDRPGRFGKMRFIA